MKTYAISVIVRDDNGHLCGKAETEDVSDPSWILHGVFSDADFRILDAIYRSINPSNQPEQERRLCTVELRLEIIEEGSESPVIHVNYHGGPAVAISGQFTVSDVTPGQFNVSDLEAIKEFLEAINQLQSKLSSPLPKPKQRPIPEL
jgi:hypothetical protein